MLVIESITLKRNGVKWAWCVHHRKKRVKPILGGGTHGRMKDMVGVTSIMED
jgi:hypothetical protein